MAGSSAFKTGLVTNAYWATSEEDAKMWLRYLQELKVSDISLSDDVFHYGDEKDTPAKLAFNAGKRMGMPVNISCVEEPIVQGIGEKGDPVIEGDVKFIGRAVEKLLENLPKKNWEGFTECPYEDLESPERVHVDPYGNVFLCQGLSMGNMWETPLSELIKNYNADSHPICKHLVKGGPALLAKEYDVKHEDKYVDACHFCYVVRSALMGKFPEHLCPRQVYGLD